VVTVQHGGRRGVEDRFWGVDRPRGSNGRAGVCRGLSLLWGVGGGQPESVCVSIV